MAGTFTRIVVKCLRCRLHFVILTDEPERSVHALGEWHCPECGQHEGAFMAKSEQREGYIFKEAGF